MELSGKTHVCAVIGDPIEHSLSPTMHNAAFEHLKLDFAFLSFRVTSDQLENAMRGVRALGIRGLNVTMPHKNAVTEFLDEGDPAVRFLHTANTILNQDGRLRGFNTDGIGAVKALKNNGVDLAGKKVLLLGAGGAAKAIAFYLAREVGEISILNRDAMKARELANVLEPCGKIEGDMLTLENVAQKLQDADILINATSAGMVPNVHESYVRPEWLTPKLCVMDIVYNPLETKLVHDAKTAGAKVINGIEMLLYQGAASFEIWIRCPAPIQVMREALLRKLAGVTS
ncbi:MAG TPA: shikimate dehydrogenase [Candidatus Sulfotelmatobacter sp.]|nr:shikimate dehydrogenase [Candidatus Sulfotelmatobacter sp.]